MVFELAFAEPIRENVLHVHKDREDHLGLTVRRDTQVVTASTATKATMVRVGAHGHYFLVKSNNTASGRNGAPGNAGPRGEKGAPGIPGADGVPGTPGNTGYRGQGKPGPKGIPGIRGDYGVQGISGINGELTKY